MPLNIAAMDIETSRLDGDWGHLLCACFKFSKSRFVDSIVVDKLEDEKFCLGEFVKIWNEIDIVYGWNSIMFDKRFINSRLLYHGMPILSSKMHIDYYWLHKHHSRTGSHSLHNVSISLGTKTRKFHVEPSEWAVAQDPSHPRHQEAIDKIVKHCKYDVLLTEEVATKLRSLVSNIQKK